MAMASSLRASVPSALGFVKKERQMDSWPLGDQNCATTDTTRTDVDKDFLCPICFQTMEDAFLTSCGHSFCYTCITTHLSNRSNCPSCARYLTTEQLIPNFLLMKVSFKTQSLLFEIDVLTSKTVENSTPKDGLWQIKPSL